MNGILLPILFSINMQNISKDMIEDHDNVFHLNLVLNNLLICVLVKSFEVVFMGFSVSINDTR